MLVPDTTKSPTEIPRIQGLDALRGLAGLSVVIFHAYLINATPHGWWMRFIGQGAEGVGLFFILSALTLGLSWDYRQRHAEPVSWWKFWMRRFWRIAPLFYLALILAAVSTHGNPTYAPPSLAKNPFNWGSLLAHVSFLFAWIPAYQNSWIGVGWSIGTEVSFYLLFPWIVERILPRWRPEGLLCLGLALIWLWPYVLNHLSGVHLPSWAGAFELWSLPRQFIWFAIGLWIWKRYDLVKPRHVIWGLLWIAMVIPIANHIWRNPGTELLVWLVPLGLLVWLVAHNLPLFAPLAHSRLLSFVGARSYGLYLLHWIVLQALILPLVPDMHRGGTWGLALRVAALLPVSIWLSHLSYRYIEKPGQALGRHLMEHWDRRRQLDLTEKSSAAKPSASR